MTKVFLPGLPKRAYLLLDTEIAPPEQDGEIKVPTGTFALLIEGKPICKSEDFAGLEAELVGVDGEWELGRCKAGGGGAVELEGLKDVPFGDTAAGPRLFLNCGAFPKVLLRRDPAVEGTYVLIRGCAVDIGNTGAQPNFGNGRNGVLWEYNNRRRSIETRFEGNWQPPGNWPGNLPAKQYRYPYLVGTRDTDKLRLELGNSFELDKEWFRVRYPCANDLKPSRYFALAFAFSEERSTAEFSFPGASDHAKIDARRSKRNLLGWFEVPNWNGVAPIDGLSVGTQWMQATIRSTLDVGLYVANTGTGADRDQAVIEVNGPTSKCRACFERKAASGEDGRVAFAWHDEGEPGEVRRPYEGLAARGIASRMGGPLRFDCAMAALVHAADGKTAQFMAGGDLSALWTPDLPPLANHQDGKLRVKQSASGERVAEAIAGETAFITLSSPGGAQDDGFRIELELARSNQSGDFHLPIAGLAAAPLDMFAEAANGSFDYWRQTHPDGLRYLAFPLKNGAARLPDDLMNGFAQVEAPLRVATNSEMHIDMVSSGIISSLVVDEARQQLVYADIGIGLLTGNGPAVREQLAELDHSKVETGNIPIVRNTANGNAIIENIGIGQLRYVASQAMLGNALSNEAKRVVSTAIGKTDHTGVGSVMLEVKGGFGLALARRVPDGSNSKLMYWNTPGYDPQQAGNFVPVLMIDADAYNYNQSSLAQHLGFTEADWVQLVAEWQQRGIFVDGGPATPRDAGWQGHIFRDFALALPNSYREKVSRWPALLALYDTLQASVIFPLAWHDANGWTLNGKLQSSGLEIADIGLMRISLLEFAMWMQHGSLSSARGRMQLELPFLEDDAGDLPSYDLVFDKTPKATLLTFDFATVEIGNGPTKLKLKGSPLGIDEIEILGGGTDLKTVTLKARLTFTEPDYLARLSDGLLIDFSVPLEEGAPAWIEAQIKDAASVSKDGWALTLTSVAFKMSNTGDAVISTRIQGVMSLGVDGFLAVRFVITMEDDISLDIKGYEGRLTIGDFSAELDMTYEEAKKAFHGKLILKSPLTGDLGLEGAIWRGAGAEVSWIAALQNNKVEGEKFLLDNAALILGRRVKPKSGGAAGSLLAALENPSATNVRGALSNTSLSAWEPDMGTDLIIGAYGNLGLDKIFFSPSDSDDTTGKDRQSGILFTSGGLFQISASSKFFGFLPVEYDISLNTDESWIYAGFQVPKFDPLGTGGGNSQFSVSGGYVGLGLGYDPKKWAFGLTVGWPYSSFLDPDIGNPDWSRAVTVKWQGAFPLNTFAGGVSLFISYRPEFALGLALRAGWTWSYSTSAWKLTAEAELGIMVGGVLHFRYTGSRYVPPPDSMANAMLYDASAIAIPPQPKEKLNKPEVDALILSAQLTAIVDEAFGDLSELASYTVKCGLFLDAWGAARVRFFGVTLVGVRIDAHAQVIMVFRDGEVTKAYAKAHFKVRVKIGCTTYSTKASFQIDFAGKGVGLTAQAALPPSTQLALPAPTAASAAQQGAA